MENEPLVMKIWRIIYPPIIYLAVSTLIQILSTIVIWFMEFYKLKKGGGVLSIGQSVEFIESIQTIIVRYSVWITLISALITLVIFYKIYKREIHFQYKISNEYFYVAALGMFSSMALSRLISLLPIDNLIGSYSEVESLLFNGNIGLEIVTIAVVVPVLEEIIFRGLVYNRVKAYTDRRIAAVTSALLFGIYHLNLVQGIYAFFIGLLLVFVYEKYDSLLAPILMHASANGLSIILTYTKISEFFSRNLFVYIIVMLLEFTGAYIIFRMIWKKSSA